MSGGQRRVSRVPGPGQGVLLWTPLHGRWAERAGLEIGLVACIGARYSLVCNKRINVKYLPRYCYNSSSQPPLARVTRIQSYNHCSWSSWWSPAYLGDGGVAGQCDVTQRCSFTSDRAMVDNSSLVMFSYTDLRLSDMPPKYLLGRRNTWLNFKRK